MRTFGHNEYPKAWTLGGHVAEFSTPPLFWRRRIGQLNVEVEPSSGNIRWYPRFDECRLRATRILASDDAALMESAQRHVLADLHRQRVDINQHIEEALADINDQLSPEEAVATTPSKTKP